ncbi:adenine phosphoribosyltransferase [Sandaracinobacter sp. RS1-74]|uniref:adenine phosphoribosyltransferase n=1 Tax=Sandaracinobacteroides sayramensis TaxID=2913411 RepID=UPI001EDC3ED7|nr:adenine phosphoribosyltransferase [Sandaracinobacteroides sayramensis]MCG2841723.1 adenine phosphoribosyltransferase [Sandaracinobacteroides sayramensis]
MTLEKLAAHVRTVADFPKAGIQFRDLTPLLADGAAFQATTAALAERAGAFDLIAGVEARGFLFGAALAQRTGHGLVLVRKPGKLPGQTIGHDYALEYGTDRLELHDGQVPKSARVLLVDDVLATGGTAAAAVELLRKSGATVTRALFVLELDGLSGAQKLRAAGVEPVSLLHFPA